MNPQQQPNYNQPPRQPAINNPLAVMQPDEQIVCEISRHPIGIIWIFLGAGLVLIALSVVTFIIIPSSSGTTVRLFSALGFFIFAILSLAFVFIANIVYWGNHWVVTTDSLTQIAQTSLFHKNTAQLSLDNLEDVTVVKHGFFAQIFNFGTLKAETAGERSKFVFVYCPNPNYYAQKILAARETFVLVNKGEETSKLTPKNPQPPNTLTTSIEQLGQAAIADYQKTINQNNGNPPN